MQRSIGLIAGSSWFAQRLVGFGRASELLLTGRHLTAAEALGWGLISARFPVDEFEEGAAAYVQSVAELPTACVGIHKAALEYSAYHGLRDSLTHETLVSAGTRGTEDADEGRSSFFERRKPTYSGR